jgi:hypothetical protein
MAGRTSTSFRATGDGVGPESVGERVMGAFLKNPALQPVVEEPWIDNRVPGTVGAITDWILAYSIRPNPVMALGVALTVVGTVVGRKVQGPQDGATHLYMIMLAPTAFGKDDPLNCGRRLLTAFDEQLIGPDEFVSSQGVWRFLKAHPLCCCFVDELGEQFALINDQKGVALSLWSSGPSRNAITHGATFALLLKRTLIVTLLGVQHPALSVQALQRAFSAP